MPTKHENEKIIPDILSDLTQEHIRILDELHIIEKSITSDPPLLLSSSFELLCNLKNFTFYDHHKREDEIIYSWMLEQNPNADKELIDRIRRDHEVLETLQQKIHQQLEDQVSKSIQFIPKSLIYELNDFIDLYRDHIELEEKFIYQIAKGILIR